MSSDVARERDFDRRRRQGESARSLEDPSSSEARSRSSRSGGRKGSDALLPLSRASVRKTRSSSDARVERTDSLGIDFEGARFRSRSHPAWTRDDCFVSMRNSFDSISLERDSIAKRDVQLGTRSLRCHSTCLNDGRWIMQPSELADRMIQVGSIYHDSERFVLLASFIRNRKGSASHQRKHSIDGTSEQIKERYHCNSSKAIPSGTFRLDVWNRTNAMHLKSLPLRVTWMDSHDC